MLFSPFCSRSLRIHKRKLLNLAVSSYFPFSHLSFLISSLCLSFLSLFFFCSISFSHSLVFLFPPFSMLNLPLSLTFFYSELKCNCLSVSLLICSLYLLFVPSPFLLHFFQFLNHLSLFLPVLSLRSLFPCYILIFFFFISFFPFLFFFCNVMLHAQFRNELG